MATDDQGFDFVKDITMGLSSTKKFIYHDPVYYLTLRMYAPLVWLPVGNQLHGLINFQAGANRFCADTEMKMVNCLEKYGSRAGHIKCRGYYLDLFECQDRNIEALRYQAMRAERQRQFKFGEREKQYDPAPALDAY